MLLFVIFLLTSSTIPYQFIIYFRKIIHEVQRVLYFMGNAGSQLTQRSHLLRLYQLLLRLFEFRQRQSLLPVIAQEDNGGDND